MSVVSSIEGAEEVNVVTDRLHSNPIALTNTTMLKPRVSRERLHNPFLVVKILSL